MNLFQNMLIKQKLMVIITFTSAAALLLAFAAFSFNDFLVYRAMQKKKLTILAHVIADNSQAAVSFNDAKAAEELLGALKAEPHIVSASILKSDGSAFAEYHAAKQALPADGYFNAGWPIELQGKNLGRVEIRANAGELKLLLRNYVLWGIAIILLCIMAAFVIAASVQQSISKPVLELAEVAKAVSKEKNYALRAEEHGKDELGELVGRFNEMLSEIQKREEALIRFNDALTRSNRDLEQFAYVASHDLQEPLRMVINYVDLLSSKMQAPAPAPEDVKLYMGFITEGARRSQSLILDLLEYSRVRAEGKIEKVDLTDTVKKSIANLKMAIEESKASVVYDKLPLLAADPVKMTQVFQNLIANAIKFQKPDETPLVQISAKKETGEWVFTVRDNGIGIDPAFADKIFVIFQRLHSRQKYPGTGIGLAICKRIIEQQGGKIWVESETGKGAAFHFTLPA